MSAEIIPLLWERLWIPWNILNAIIEQQETLTL